MIDGVMRQLVARPLGSLARSASAHGITANGATLAGLAFAVACGAAIAWGSLSAALACLALSRICDGLDGAIARRTRLTDFGGFLDIVCDFAFYAAVPIGFAVLDRGGNALAAAVLLASFYLNAASFLGFAILAARRGMETVQRGPKSLYFTTGLAEGSETIAVFIAMLVWPAAFPGLAYGFAALCLITCIARVLLAARVFAVDDRNDPPS